MGMLHGSELVTAPGQTSAPLPQHVWFCMPTMKDNAFPVSLLVSAARFLNRCIRSIKLAVAARKLTVRPRFSSS